MAHLSRLFAALPPLLPGLALCAAIAGAARLLQSVEARLLGEPYVEALVLAILLGALMRSLWEPGPRWAPGVAFSARPLLETAIVLLGASISFAMVARSGATLIVIILTTVALTLAAGYGLSRLLGLPPKLAALIACGNAVCGNSAIAAVAPAIGASGDDVASSISFTAVLGVIVVLALPLAIPLLRLSETQYGVLAGLTVYAVPQVLAATAVAGPTATQIGTLVKLMRVLTLGPIVLGAAILFRERGGDLDGAPGRRLPVGRLAPWFIIGFLALATLRSFGLIPPDVVAIFAKLSGAMTVVAMAALGLGVDLHALRRVGARATAAVTLSLITLTALSLAAIWLGGVK